MGDLTADYNVRNDTPRTYDEAVRVLAEAHAAGDAMIEFFVIPDGEEEVVRLVEVSDDFPEAGVERPKSPDGFERVVPVFAMGRSRDFPFRSEVAQVTRSEWDQLRNGTLFLTRVWDLSQARKVRVND